MVSLVTGFVRAHQRFDVLYSAEDQDYRRANPSQSEHCLQQTNSQADKHCHATLMLADKGKCRIGLEANSIAF